MLCNKYCVRTLLCLLLLASFAAAQRGKISGRVIDGDTKEPLFGVNILLKGLQQGSSTDLEGNYVIQNVMPGSYTVVASMIGYNQTQSNNVIVNIDRTTLLHIALKSSAVQMGTVIVEAKQPVVVKDRTSTATTIEGRDVQNAPVEGLREVMELNASLQRNPEGTFSLRGSGGYDVNVLVNGVEQMNSNTGIPGFSTIGNKSNNSWKSDFNPLGVQQMEIISGGFSSEYGNAQAGVVKIVTREGGPKLSGQFRYEYRPPGQYHWGKYIYDTDPATSIEWRNWGTIDAWKKMIDSASIYRDYLRDPVTGTVKDVFNGDTLTVDKWRELMWQQWVLNHTPSDENLLGAYDYRNGAYNRFLFSFGGPLGKNSDLLKFFFAGEYRSAPTRLPTPEKNQTYQNYNLNVTYQPVQMSKFRFTGIYQGYRGGIYSGSEDIRWAGRDGSYKYYLVTDSPREEYTSTQSLNWTYTFNQKSFLDVLVTHQYEKYVLKLEPVPQRAASWRDNVFKGQWYQFAGPWDESYRTIFSFVTFSQQDLRSHQYAISADYTNQITQFHDIKVGVRGTYWDMFNSAVYSSFAANAYISRTGYAEYYHSFPYYLAAYIQDKMEFEGLVANIGFRVDAYNFNVSMPANRFNPFYIAEGSEAVGDPTATLPATHITYSPRLGLSFPIGEQTAFRLQYGHFSSMPIFKQAYTSTNELGWAAYGNPDLDAKTTINYEFGVQHSFEATHRLDVVAYYIDRVSQVDIIRIRANSGGIRRNKLYTSYDNNQFGSSRGVEATFEKVAAGRWGYRLSYALSRTTYGNYGPLTLYSPDPNDPRNTNAQNAASPIDFLSYDDRTHTFRTLISYNIEKDGGIEIAGMKPCENMIVSLIYSAQSGSPYTYVSTYDPLYIAFTKGQVTNNRRFPLEAKTDININKSLKIFGFEASLGIRVTNVFDNKWFTPISNPQLQDWVEAGITMDNPVTMVNAVPDYSQKVYKENFFRVYRNMPRQLFFIFGFSF